MALAEIPHIVDHEDRAETRMAKIFREFPDLVELFRLFARQVQVLEDAGYTLVTLLNDIDNAGTAELNRIGKVIGQPRNGKSNTDYRPLLRARILVNNSQTDRETILSIFQALLGSKPIITEMYPAQAYMDMGTTVAPFTEDDVKLFFTFIFKAKAAAVRVMWLYWVCADNEVFRCDTVGQGCDQGKLASIIDRI